VSLNEANEIVEKLKFWKSEEYISLREACILAMDLDPYEQHNFEDHKDVNAPSSYVRLYESLDKLIMNEYFHTVIKYQEYEYGDVPESELYPKNAFFWPENVIFDNYGLVSVSQYAIKHWLATNNIDTHYYNSLSTPEKDRNNLTVSNNHMTRLMAIMYDVIENELANYNPKDGSTFPKQEYLISMIESKYNVSNIAAKSIDKLIRPQSGLDYPDGEKHNKNILL